MNNTVMADFRHGIMTIALAHDHEHRYIDEIQRTHRRTERYPCHEVVASNA